MMTPPPRRTAALACTLLALAALTGCGPHDAGTSAARPATPPPATATPTNPTSPAGGGTTASPAAGAPAGNASSPGGAASVTLDEHANHTRITVRLGTTVRLQLHSTYWSAPASSDPGRLAPQGAPTTLPGPSCRPGSGCGTLTTAFTTRSTGAVQLTSRRTSCGEAKPCPPDQQTFTVDIDVTP
ncbi:hypothetical protein [Kitasatospora sp. NPDC059571]|uniref:hypothetical protein n=1 Tax=Kitasatospora sp. NPDC059571 TaxID=3346871 RepID=UPI00367370FF